MDRYLIWDFDGTLATREGGWTGSLCDVVRAAYPDLPIDPERVRPYFRRGLPWHEPDVVRDPCSADAWWERLHAHFEEALVEGADLSTTQAAPLARGMREAYTGPSKWVVYEDTVRVLTELRERGWRHLVLSNHVPELKTIVRRLELAALLDAVYCSAELGVEKPNPAAFERVLADYPAARAGWMIGDNWRADVEGARGVGLKGILVRREHPEARVRCETLDDVVPIVLGDPRATPA
jgi:putative hydrolase of the HAD superfamily